MFGSTKVIEKSSEGSTSRGTIIFIIRKINFRMVSMPKFYLLVRCRYGNVIFLPSSLIVFPFSHWQVPFPPCSLPFALHLDPYGFPKRKKSFKPKCSWENPKGSCWRAKATQRWRNIHQRKRYSKNRANQATRNWRPIQQEIDNTNKKLNSFINKSELRNLEYQNDLQISIFKYKIDLLG